MLLCNGYWVFSRGKVIMARRQNQSKPMEIVYNVMVQNCSLKVHKVPIIGRMEYGDVHVARTMGDNYRGSENHPLFEQVSGGGV
jgi:hypothetical protein